MSAAIGLSRLGSVLKGAGYAFGALSIASAMDNKPSSPGFAVLCAVPAIGLWVVGWIVQGFAKR